MISSQSIDFLKKLLDTPGPSGFEAAPAKVWRGQAKKFAKVSGDVAGNSLAEVNSEGRPTIMLAGHIDEIGVIVSYVDDQGIEDRYRVWRSGGYIVTVQFWPNLSARSVRLSDRWGPCRWRWCYAASDQ